MRFWLNHTGEVSLREQLITQVVLAILVQGTAPRPAAAQHPRSGAALRHPSQHGQRRLSRTWSARAGLSSATAAASLCARPALRAALAGAGRRVCRRSLIGELDGQGAQAGRAGVAGARATAPLAHAQPPPSRWLVIEPDPELRAHRHARDGAGAGAAGGRMRSGRLRRARHCWRARCW
jgi:hypothetical protein